MVEQRNIDWFQIKNQIPFTDSQEDKINRDRLWRQVDINGNGLVSLAELDKALRDNLRCYQVYDCKPAIIRAWTISKDRTKFRRKLSKNKVLRKYQDHYMIEEDFKRCLQYLRLYFEYFQAFARIDTGDDRRIDRNEFRAAVKNDHIFNVEVKNPDSDS